MHFLIGYYGNEKKNFYKVFHAFMLTWIMLFFSMHNNNTTQILQEQCCRTVLLLYVIRWQSEICAFISPGRLISNKKPRVARQVIL